MRVSKTFGLLIQTRETMIELMTNRWSFFLCVRAFCWAVVRVLFFFLFHLHKLMSNFRILCIQNYRIKMRILSDERKYVGFFSDTSCVRRALPFGTIFLVEARKNRIKSRRVWEAFKSLRAANNDDAGMKSLEYTVEASDARPTQINQYSASRFETKIQN